MTLTWSDQRKTEVTLTKGQSQFCIYKGSFVEDLNSRILVTGCKNEVKMVQIHSFVYGDTFATALLNGTVILLENSEDPNPTTEATGQTVILKKFGMIENNGSIASLEWSDGQKLMIPIIDDKEQCIYRSVVLAPFSFFLIR